MVIQIQNDLANAVNESLARLSSVQEFPDSLVP